MAAADAVALVLNAGICSSGFVRDSHLDELPRVFNITGPWQISTMGSVALHDHPELDNAYVEQASFRSDMRIIWITFLGVLGAKPLEPGALMKRLRWRS